MPAQTSAASAICGTHFGLTKADTSIMAWPAADSLLTKAILSGVGTNADSFCSPSRGPTSTIRTRDGRELSFTAEPAREPRTQNPEPRTALSFEIDERNARLHEIAGRAGHRRHAPIARRDDRQLHFHRLQHDQHVAAHDHLSGRHVDGR